MDNEDSIEEILKKVFSIFRGTEDELIPILQQVQKEAGYLPEQAMLDIAGFTGVPESRVYAVATFYAQFRFTPIGRNHVTVCRGTACHVRGASQVLNKIERRLSIKTGQTSKDLMFTLETVNCLGACALGPVVMIDGEYHGQMTQAKVDRLLDRYTEAAGGKHDPEKS